MNNQSGHILILLLCFLGIAALILENAWELAALEQQMARTYRTSPATCSPIST